MSTSDQPATIFLNNLSRIYFQFDPSTLPPGYVQYAYAGIQAEWLQGTHLSGTTTVANSTTPGLFVSEMDAWLATFDAGSTNVSVRNVFPRTWDDFITAFRTKFNIPNPSGTTRSGPAYLGFLQEFAQILQTDLNTSGDLQGLNLNIPEELVSSFNKFLDSFIFTKVQVNTAAGPNAAPIYNFVTGTLDTFLAKWRHFMTVTSVSDTASEQGSYANLASYEQIYKAFFPDSTQQEMDENINKFIAEMKEQNQYFIPSQFEANFFAQMKDRYLASIAALSSVNGTGSAKLEVLWRVFALVVKMIAAIQNVTAITAQRLNFLTMYQKAYTDLIASIPVFTKGDASAFGPDLTSPFNYADARNDLNSKNNIYTTNLTSFRGLLEDEAKGVQSKVNSLNESVNSQANLATSLLQEMSTILQAIFR